MIGWHLSVGNIVQVGHHQFSPTSDSRKVYSSLLDVEISPLHYYWTLSSGTKHYIEFYDVFHELSTVLYKFWGASDGPYSSSSSAFILLKGDIQSQLEIIAGNMPAPPGCQNIFFESLQRPHVPFCK